MSLSFRDWSRRRTLTVILGLLFVLFLIFVARYQHVFNPLLVGAMLAYVLDPCVVWLQNKGIGRKWAVISIFSSAGVLLLLMMGVASTFMVKQVDHFVMAIPGEPYTDLNQNGRWDEGEDFEDRDGNGQRREGYTEKLQGLLFSSLEAFNRSYPELALDADDLKGRVQSQMSSVKAQFRDHGKEWGANALEAIKHSFGGMVNLLIFLALVPMYCLFLLMGLENIYTWIGNHLPSETRDRTLRIFKKMDGKLSAFFRGKLIVSILKGVAGWLLLALCEVPFAFVIGMTAGLLCIIPMVGYVGGMLVGSFFFILDHGFGPAVLLVPAAMTLVEGIEFVLNVTVLGKEVEIHPLALVLSLFLGGELFGLFGVIMAIPLVSVFEILFKEFVQPVLDELRQPPSTALS